MKKPNLQDYLSARERPATPVVMKQEWRQLLFLHWQVPVAELQAKLPDGLYVDTHDGKAYAGIVPFFMDKIRPVFLPPIPGLSWFQELNFRTYVHDEDGRPGVWFFTLDCNQWLAVKIARSLFHLPYHHAKMNASEHDKGLFYQSQRKGDKLVQEFVYPSEASDAKETEPGSLDFFLVERYRLYSQKKGKLYQGLVHHQAYQVTQIDPPPHSKRLFSLCGLEEPEGDPVSALVAETVKVDIHPLQRLPLDQS